MEFVPNQSVRLLQEALAIATWMLSTQSHVNIMLRICDQFGDITDAANTHVAWLSYVLGRSLHWKKLKYMGYNNFLKAVDSSSCVIQMIKQHHSVQSRETPAIKQLRNCCQHYLELPQIFSDSSRSDE